MKATARIIGKSMNHKKLSTTTAIYAQLDLDPVRASVERVAEAMPANVDAPLFLPLLKEGADDVSWQGTGKTEKMKDVFVISSKNKKKEAP